MCTPTVVTVALLLIMKSNKSFVCHPFERRVIRNGTGFVGYSLDYPWWGFIDSVDRERGTRVRATPTTVLLSFVYLLRPPTIH